MVVPGRFLTPRVRAAPVGVLLSTVALFTAVIVAPATAPSRPLPAILWGVTLDNTADIATPTLTQEVNGLQALPEMPVARIVMDVGTKPAAYASAVAALHPVSFLMAELGDSSEMKGQTVAAYQRFEQALVTAYGGSIDVWEIGNEVNGEWVGSTKKEVAKITDAYDTVTAAGGATALTLYYNPHCATKPSHQMFSWAEANIPAAMKAGLDDVFISYYPDDCHGYWPSAAGWQSVFDQLHAIFPQARLGFGESGISSDKGTAATKAALLTKYYTLDITGDNYVGGYFWWYFAEDALPYQGNAVWNALASAMTDDHAPLVAMAGHGPMTDSTSKARPWSRPGRTAIPRWPESPPGD